MNKILTYIIIVVCLFIGLQQSTAQVDEVYDDEIADTTTVGKKKKTPKDREKKQVNPLNMKGLFVGTGVGFDIWNNYLRFDMSPHIGYRIGDILAPAVGMTYIFFNELGSKNNTNVIGPKAMLRIRPIKNVPTLNRIYLIGEAEYLSFKEKYNTQTYTYTQTRLNAGLGYTTNFEQGFGFVTELMFDFNYLRTGISYINPITYRIGFYYGF